MKKITLLFALLLSLNAFSVRYLVQQGSTGAPTWRAAASGEVLVDLTVEAKTLNAWFTTTTFTNADEVWVINGTYNFTAAYAFPTAGLDVFGGFAGTETTIADRAKGTEPWTFINETILEGNNNAVQIFTPGGARINTIIDGLTINKAGAGGGAAIVGRDGMVFRNCKFTNNISTGNGGALLLNGGGSVYDSYFANNKGNSGGAMHCGTSAGFSSEIKNCVFENNQAAGGSNNLGGALRSQAAGTLNVDQCVFINNSAVANGAAIHIQMAAATNNTTVSNSLIYGSTTKGAIYMLGGTLRNVTAVNNVDGGVYVASATVPSSIYNSVFWGSGSSGAVTSVASNASAILQNNAIVNLQTTNFTGANNSNNIVLSAENSGTDEGVFYPNFVDPIANDWQITHQSALLNAGQTFATLTSDLMGIARAQGSAFDIGAYELPYYNVSVDYNEGGEVQNHAAASVLSAPKGKMLEFTIQPNSGQTIASVLYNNVEVKDQLQSNVFVTPALLADATLVVAFSTTTNVDATISSLKVFANENGLELNGLSAGQNIAVYNANGMRVLHEIANTNTMSIRLNKGFYVLKVGADVHKVIVK